MNRRGVTIKSFEQLKAEYALSVPTLVDRIARSIARRVPAQHLQTWPGLALLPKDLQERLVPAYLLEGDELKLPEGNPEARPNPETPKAAAPVAQGSIPPYQNLPIRPNRTIKSAEELKAIIETWPELPDLFSEEELNNWEKTCEELNYDINAVLLHLIQSKAVLHKTAFKLAAAYGSTTVIEKTWEAYQNNPMFPPLIANNLEQLPDISGLSLEERKEFFKLQFYDLNEALLKECFREAIRHRNLHFIHWLASKLSRTKIAELIRKNIDVFSFHPDERKRYFSDADLPFLIALNSFLILPQNTLLDFIWQNFISSGNRILADDQAKLLEWLLRVSHPDYLKPMLGVRPSGTSEFSQKVFDLFRPDHCNKKCLFVLAKYRNSKHPEAHLAILRDVFYALTHCVYPTATENLAEFWAGLSDEERIFLLLNVKFVGSLLSSGETGFIHTIDSFVNSLSDAELENKIRMKIGESITGMQLSTACGKGHEEAVKLGWQMIPLDSQGDWLEKNIIYIDPALISCIVKNHNKPHPIFELGKFILFRSGRHDYYSLPEVTDEQTRKFLSQYTDDFERVTPAEKRYIAAPDIFASCYAEYLIKGTTTAQQVLASLPTLSFLIAKQPRQFVANLSIPHIKKIADSCWYAYTNLRVCLEYRATALKALKELWTESNPEQRKTILGDMTLNQIIEFALGQILVSPIQYINGLDFIIELAQACSNCDLGFHQAYRELLRTINFSYNNEKFIQLHSIILSKLDDKQKRQLFEMSLEHPADYLAGRSGFQLFTTFAPIADSSNRAQLLSTQPFGTRTSLQWQMMKNDAARQWPLFTCAALLLTVALGVAIVAGLGLAGIPLIMQLSTIAYTITLAMAAIASLCIATGAAWRWNQQAVLHQPIPIGVKATEDKASGVESKKPEQVSELGVDKLGPSL